jgi:citrate synthase
MYDQTSKISYIDGDKGVLEYRGIPIEQLAESSTFTEVAYLLINGELPTKQQLSVWDDRIMSHTFLHTDALTMMNSFRYDAHPMVFSSSNLRECSSPHFRESPPSTLRPTLHFQDKMCTSPERCGTSRSTDCWA